MSWRRALYAWLVIMAAETVHGVLRQLLLVPLIGDLPARQIGVGIGSLIVLGVALAFTRRIGARSLREQLGVGLLWAVSTVAFEYALGTLLGLSRERMLEDYDVAAGGLLGLGLLVMLISPVVAARLRP